MMKEQQNCMFTSKTDEWETPQALFDEINREFDFSLDVCAIPENAKCIRYYTPVEMEDIISLQGNRRQI